MAAEQISASDPFRNLGVRSIIGFDDGRAPGVFKQRFLRQSSSGVEQRTHKPLVGGSNPSSGTIPQSLQEHFSTSEHKRLSQVAQNAVFPHLRVPLPGFGPFFAPASEENVIILTLFT